MRSTVSRLAECSTGPRLPVVYLGGPPADSDDLSSLGKVNLDRLWQASDAPSRVRGRGIRRFLGLWQHEAGAMAPDFAGRASQSLPN